MPSPQPHLVSSMTRQQFKLSLPPMVADQLQTLGTLRQNLIAQQHRNKFRASHGHAINVFHTEEGRELVRELGDRFSLDNFIDALQQRMNPPDRPGAHTEELRRKFPMTTCVAYVIGELISRHGDELREEMQNEYQKEAERAAEIRPEY